MIKISNLSKSFGSFKAVENLDINIQKVRYLASLDPMVQEKRQLS